MKTALLLPGHMRRFREALANQHACVVEPLNCDIFISTSTADTSVNGNNIYVENHLLGDLQRLVRGAYGSRLKGLVVEEGESEKEAKLGAKQWMRLKQCNQARKEYEKENGFKYDFVVRARTDILFSRELSFDDVVEGSISLLPHFDSKIEIHDQFAFGQPDLMDIYCELYDHFLPRDQGGRSEDQLYNWLMKNKIKLLDVSSNLQFSMLRGHSQIEVDKLFSFMDGFSE